MEKTHGQTMERHDADNSYVATKKRSRIYPLNLAEIKNSQDDSRPMQNLNLIPTFNRLLNMDPSPKMESDKNRVNVAPLKQRIRLPHFGGNMQNGTLLTGRLNSFKLIAKRDTKLNNTQLALKEISPTHIATIGGFNPPPPQFTQRDCSAILNDPQISRIKGDFSALSCKSIMSELSIQKESKDPQADSEVFFYSAFKLYRKMLRIMN